MLRLSGGRYLPTFPSAPLNKAVQLIRQAIGPNSVFRDLVTLRLPHGTMDAQ
jgi:predicted esterase YcpF (UPF0227 family)